jgi:hypothetical protein
MALWLGVEGGEIIFHKLNLMAYYLLTTSYNQAAKTLGHMEAAVRSD